MGPDKVEVRPTNLCPKENTKINATMALAELAEKGADVDVLHQMVQFMAPDGARRRGALRRCLRREDAICEASSLSSAR